MEKQFKTIDEQIELLQSRNLHIENEEIAKEIFSARSKWVCIKI